MSEAEKRVADLLDRWLASLELHTRYLKLDDAAYAHVQGWPKHQRPNKWIIDVAKQRVAELKQHLEERKELGDDDFAESLELMGFLTSLLATEHIERFVPLALPPRDATVRQAALKSESSATATVRARAPTAKQPAARPAAAKSATAKVATARPLTARPPAPATVRKSTGSTGALKSPAARPAAPATRAAAPMARPAERPAARLSERIINTVVDDAVRLLNWGSEWPQLAGLIARLADRPSEKEVWAVLIEHRAIIESRAKPRSD
jgi:hypothetical protein